MKKRRCIATVSDAKTVPNPFIALSLRADERHRSTIAAIGNVTADVKMRMRAAAETSTAVRSMTDESLVLDLAVACTETVLSPTPLQLRKPLLSVVQSATDHVPRITKELTDTLRAALVRMDAAALEGLVAVFDLNHMLGSLVVQSDCLPYFIEKAARLAGEAVAPVAALTSLSQEQITELDARLVLIVSASKIFLSIARLHRQALAQVLSEGDRFRQMESALLSVVHSRHATPDAHFVIAMVMVLLFETRLSPAEAALAWRAECFDKAPSDFAALAACRGAMSSGSWPFKLAGPAECISKALLTVAQRASDHATRILAFQSLTEWTAMLQLATTELPSEQALAIINTDALSAVVDYSWQFWEDPVPIVAHRVRDLFANAAKVFKWLDDQAAAPAPARPSADINSHFGRLLARALGLDWRVKSRYRPLLILLPDVDVEWLLRTGAPSLLDDTLSALAQSLTMQSACELYVALVVAAQRFLPRAEWEALWVPGVAAALVSPSGNMRTNVTVYCLKDLLPLADGLFDSLFAAVRSLPAETPAAVQHRVSASMALLQAGRELGYASLDSYGAGELLAALQHRDLQVRIDALGLICNSRRAVTPVTAVEYALLRDAYLPHNLHETSADFRFKQSTYLDRFFRRIRDSVFHMAKERSARSAAPDLHETDIRNARDFCEWFVEWICMQMFPSARFQHVTSALEWLGLFAKVFSLAGTVPPPSTYVPRPEAKVPTFPFPVRIMTARLVRLLLGILQDTFEKNRRLALALLEEAPVPWPGVETRAGAAQLMQQALAVCDVPRGLESDGGAMLVQVLFSKYVCELGWNLLADDGDENMDAQPDANTPVVFAHALLSRLERQMDAAQADLGTASRSAPMFGLVTAVRYVLQRVSLRSNEEISMWSSVLQRILALSARVLDIVAPIMTNVAPEGSAAAGDDDADALGGGEQMDGDDEAMAEGGETSAHVAVLSLCWRSTKATSFLLAQVLGSLPRHLATPSVVDTALSVDDALGVARLFAHHLLSVRHLGAICSLADGFEIICTLLVRSQNRRLQLAPGELVADLLEKLETFDTMSVTRRSAGLPYLVVAVLHAEPTSPSSRHLMATTMKSLFALAAKPAGADDDADADTDSSQARAELPQVHAFNILRMIFRDARLAPHVSAFLADAFMLAITRFGAPRWAVRNCATMLYGMLVARVFATAKNSSGGGLRPAALTSRDFFARFPAMHGFLLQQLTQAVNDTENHTALHPGLHPILTLLARLDAAADGDAAFSLAPFVPLLRRCARSSIFQVRTMAARALVPAVLAGAAVNELLGEMCAMAADAACAPLQQNMLHGLVMQLREVAVVAAATSDASGLVARFTDAVQRAPLLLAAANKGNVTRAALIALVVDLAERVGREKCAALLDVAQRAATSVAEKENCSPVGRTELRVQLARLALCAAATGDSITLAERCATLLNDEAVTVRTVALQFIADNGALCDIAGVREAVSAAVLERRSPPPPPGLTVAAIDALAVIAQPDRLLDVIDELNAMARAPRPLAVRAAASAGLGRVLRLSGDAPLIAAYVELLEELSDEAQPLPLRDAAADGLMELFPGLASAPARALLVAARLMQDDHDDVRARVLLSTDEPLASEVAARRCYERIVSMEGEHAGKLLLARIVLPEAAVQGDPVEAARRAVAELDIDGDDYSKRLFAREEHNVYRQPVSDAVAAFAALRARSATWSVDAAAVAFAETACGELEGRGGRASAAEGALAIRVGLFAACIGRGDIVDRLAGPAGEAIHASIPAFLSAAVKPTL